MTNELNKYKDALRELLDPLIPTGSYIALFDFPNHPNVGDSAIWLGEQAYIRDRVDLRLIYTDSVDFLRRKPIRFPERTVILIHGGGNLGDLYWHHQKLRELIVSTYKKHRVIQLPQSIYFSSDRKKEKCARVFNDHADFHLLVRDEQSLQQGKNLNGGNVTLAPDMALYLGSLKKVKKPRYNTVELLRTDNERSIDHESDTARSDRLTVDWLDEPWSGAKWIIKAMEKTPRLRSSPSRLPCAARSALYQKMARERFERGCALLCRGNYVITDRLHAHILASLLGIPHIVLDNNYKKISSFRAAWRTGEGFCDTAKTLFEARQKISETGGMCQRLSDG